MVNKKTVAIILIALIVLGVFLLFFFLPTGEANRLEITFYNEGAEVGRADAGSFFPLSLFLGIVEIEGVEVNAFSVQVYYFTNDPNANALDWAIDIEVYRTAPTYPYVATYYKNLLWTAGRGSMYWEEQEGGRGGWFGSPIFNMADFTVDLPDDVDFFLKFTGTFRFLNKDIDPTGANPLFEGDFTPVTISAFHSAYTYTATIDTSEE